VLLSPASPISDDEMGVLVSNLEQRINVYGISDVTIRSVSDLSGKQIHQNRDCRRDRRRSERIISKQGKFEAKNQQHHSI